MRNKMSDITELMKSVSGRAKLVKMNRQREIPALSAKTANNEDIELDIGNNNILMKVYQSNGAVRVSEYDENGYSCGDRYDGRWNS
jgi:hypothetical protein